MSELRNWILPDTIVHSAHPFASPRYRRYESGDENPANKVGDIIAAKDISHGAGVIVAVIDTGASLHPRLQYKNALSSLNSGNAIDGNGHGTHCCGIVAARVGKDDGYVGVGKEIDVISIKALLDDGSGYDDDIARGIDVAVREKCDIISMSIGSTHHSASIKSAIDRAVSAGIIIFAAAGNSGRGSPVQYPASYENVIAVGSVSVDMVVSDFSSRGRYVDCVGVGEKVCSTWLGGGYALLSGTSMATPQVAGIYALLLSSIKKNGLKPPTYADILHYLRSGYSLDVSAPGHDPDSGYGFPLVYQLMLGGKNQPPKEEHKVISDLDLQMLLDDGYSRITIKLS